MSSARDDAGWDDDDGHMKELHSRKRLRRSLSLEESNQDLDEEEASWLGHATCGRRKVHMYVAEVDDDADMPLGRVPRAEPYAAEADDGEWPRNALDDSLASWGVGASGGGEEDELPRGRTRHRRTASNTSPPSEPAPGLSFSSPPESNRSSGLFTHAGEDPEGSGGLVLPADGEAAKIGPQVSVAGAEVALHADGL